MKHADELDIKAEIDQISKKIDAILKKVEDVEADRSPKNDDPKED